MLFFSNLLFLKKIKNNRDKSSMSYCHMVGKIDKFANFISGEWTNKKQADEFPSLWSHIQVCYRPLDFEFLNGYSFYVESAYNYSLDQPYKSGILLLKENDNRIETNNFSIIGPEDFWYASYDPTLLDELTKERLISLPEGCNTIFEYESEKETFKGQTYPGKSCIIPKNNKKTYLDSSFILKKDEYFSLDIGRDTENDEQIWGSKDSPFHFYKKQSFPV